jgi:hypothetical protein
MSAGSADAGVVLTDAQKRMAKYQKLEKIGEGITNNDRCTHMHALPVTYYWLMIIASLLSMNRYIWFGI